MSNPTPPASFWLFVCKALVVNDEIVRFRRALIIRQQGATGAALEGGGDDGWDAIYATRTSLAQTSRAPSFDEPASTGGSDDVSLQSTSLVESKAITALRKRDRVRETPINLDGEAFADYSVFSLGIPKCVTA